MAAPRRMAAAYHNSYALDIFRPTPDGGRRGQGRESLEPEAALCQDSNG